MRSVYRIVFPHDDLAGSERRRHVNDALVGRAAKTQRDVVKLLDVGAVHEHVDAGEHAVGDLGTTQVSGIEQILEQVAREAPDGLVRKLGLHALEKVHETTLIARLHRLAAQKREPADVRRAYALDELVFHLARERLAEIEAPGLGLEALRAMMRAATHEQRRARAGAVGDVTVFNLGVVHRSVLSVKMKMRQLL